MQADNGCSHYRRKCMIKAPCCGEFHVCRKCHDESHVDHEIDRFSITVMKCLCCETVQPVSNECTGCRRQMAHYYCDICHLFDDVTEGLFHCDHCGFCLRPNEPGNNNKVFAHCFRCNCCRVVGHTEHTDFRTACPICLFEMVGDTVYLPACGHPMHFTCADNYTGQGNYKCPLCAKTLGCFDMNKTWADMDEAIRTQPMPPEYVDTIVSFQCNDCNLRHTSPLNFIGYKCTQCGGYNTTKV